MIEIEVDSLENCETFYRQVLTLCWSTTSVFSVVGRGRHAKPYSTHVELEASGNVKLDTIAEIAKTGVERISSGALTHQASWLDLGMDWASDL